MINDLKNTWLKVIKKPGDFFEQMPTMGGYADPIKFAAICYLASSNSSISPTLGDGWFKETFYREDKKIGFLSLLIGVMISAGILLLMRR